MSFKDHFSGHAGSYARYRPDYPGELFDYLATLTPRREMALDCATGNGQAAIGLARHFERVIATDGSIAQLGKAQVDPRVVYLGNLAEQPALKDGSVDLAVAAQAAHWFDHARFHPEMRRVLRPDGALAIWAYGLAFVSPPIDAAVKRFYEDVVGQYWPAERRHVESAYRDLPFPWREVAAPPFQLRLDWDLDSFLGYIGTWSAVQRYIKVSGNDPLPLLRAEIACAVRRHGLSVGANPTRQLSFQPEAIGAAAEATKRLEHPGVEGHEKVVWRVHRPNASKR